MGQRLIEGRNFTDEDLDTRLPVAIVNAAFAQKHFGQESAIGRRFRTVDNAGTQFGPWRTIVGVVTTIRMQAPFNAPNVDDTGFYVPFYSTVRPGRRVAVRQPVRHGDREPRGGQRADALGTACGGRSTRSIPICRSTSSIRQAEPRGVRRPEPDHRDDVLDLRRGRRGAGAVGIYGVMSFSVNQRRQEFGVRMALGAANRRILAWCCARAPSRSRWAWRWAWRLAGDRHVRGRRHQNTLFGVSARDPLTFAVVVTVVIVVSLVAMLVPARRATRVDPMIALRAE